MPVHVPEADRSLDQRSPARPYKVLLERTHTPLHMTLDTTPIFFPVTSRDELVEPLKVDVPVRVQKDGLVEVFYARRGDRALDFRDRCSVSMTKGGVWVGVKNYAHGRGVTVEALAEGFESCDTHENRKGVSVFAPWRFVFADVGEYVFWLAYCYIRYRLPRASRFSCGMWSRDKTQIEVLEENRSDLKLPRSRVRIGLCHMVIPVSTVIHMMESRHHIRHIGPDEVPF